MTTYHIIVECILHILHISYMYVLYMYVLLSSGNKHSPQAEDIISDLNQALERAFLKK